MTLHRKKPKRNYVSFVGGSLKFNVARFFLSPEGRALLIRFTRAVKS